MSPFYIAQEPSRSLSATQQAGSTFGNAPKHVSRLVHSQLLLTPYSGARSITRATQQVQLPQIRSKPYRHPSSQELTMIGHVSLFSRHSPRSCLPSLLLTLIGTDQNVPPLPAANTNSRHSLLLSRRSLIFTRNIEHRALYISILILLLPMPFHLHHRPAR
jgi:hypothetical protein